MGWTDGRNLRIDIRWAQAMLTTFANTRRNWPRSRRMSSSPTGTATVAALLQATRTVPIVFVIVVDPVGAGFVESLARPGGNATGFMPFEYGMSGKWLELLKEIAPRVTRAAVLRDPAIASGLGQFGAIQAVAPGLGVELSPINVRDAGEIERAVSAFARSPNGGLIVTGSPLVAVHRELIVKLAARHKLPAVYFRRLFVARRRPDLLWAGFCRPIPASRRLRRSHPQGGEAGRFAGAGADQIRNRHQSQDRQGTRPRRAIHSARARRRGDRMIRREFITLSAARRRRGRSRRGRSSASACGASGCSRARPGTIRIQARLAAFLRVLQQLGWTNGRNVRIDDRWRAGNADDTRRYAAELVALAPDVILATGPTVAQVLQATRTVPIVFVVVTDPVGAGFVDSLARPGGNVTGFMLLEYSLSAKWLELLKQIAPAVTRAAVLRTLANTAGIGQFAVIQSVAPSLGMEVSPVNVHDAGEIERAVTAFARSSNGGLIMTASALTAIHRDLIITLAAQHKLPAVYYNRSFVDAGGLISYGPDYIDQYRHAADYVDRILRGEKPADLPVQAPTKYELVINLKTAKALGLEVPPSLLARADEVIE